MGYSQYYGLTGGGGLSLPNFRGKGQSFSFSYNEGVSSGGQNNYIYQGSNVADQRLEELQLALQILWLTIQKIY